MSSETKEEPKQFSHIEVRLIRNQQWLKNFEEIGMLLSDDFPLAKSRLPKNFENMNATTDFDKLQKIMQEKMKAVVKEIEK